MKDISRWLANGFPTWPGDPPFLLEPALQISRGDAVNTARVTTPTHVGSHIDAPFHYHPEGAKLEQIPPELLIGPCRVLQVGDRFLERLADMDSLPPRVLLYTGQPARWERFPESYRALDPAEVEQLALLGAQLIGVDAPSVDPLDSRELPAHQACFRHGLIIAEGLDLTGVSEGLYQLICLPMPLAGADGAPLRAILL
jgi:arylformamidase